jgi:hypothetical protein
MNTQGQDIYRGLPLEQEAAQRRFNKERIALLEASSKERLERLAQVEAARKKEARASDES